MGAVQYFYESLYDGPKYYRNVIALFSVVGLLPLLKYYNYIYDFPHLFLITLALSLLVRKNWALYLVVFLFCCFNKETSILLVMVFFFYFLGDKRMDKSKFWKLLLIQMGIFVLVKGILTIIFMDNPGHFVEFHLYDYNLIRLRKIKPLEMLLWGSGAVFLIFFHWLRKPRFLKVSLLMLIPLVSLTLLLGFIDEWRDYYEVYPVLLLLVAHTVGSLGGVQMSDITKETSHAIV